jgi:hypothetical protein
MTQDEEVRYAFAELAQTFYDELNALMKKVDARARAEEREACAKLCDEFDAENPHIGQGRACAFEIRARGEQ